MFKSILYHPNTCFGNVQEYILIPRVDLLKDYQVSCTDLEKEIIKELGLPQGIFKKLSIPQGTFMKFLVQPCLMPTPLYLNNITRIIQRNSFFAYDVLLNHLCGLGLIPEGNYYLSS